MRRPLVPRSVCLIVLLAALLPSGPSVSATASHLPLALCVLQQSYHRTELYFGRSIPSGGEVSVADWEKFLTDVVTPRFPDGFSVIPAGGQYRGRDRSIIKEPSEILIFLYPNSKRASSSRKIEEIRRAYKRQFRQESVLRVDTVSPVRVSF